MCNLTSLDLQNMNYYCFQEFLPDLQQPCFITSECLEKIPMMLTVKPNIKLQLCYCLFCNSEINNGLLVVEYMLMREVSPSASEAPVLLLKNEPFNSPSEPSQYSQNVFAEPEVSIKVKSISPRLCCYNCSIEYKSRYRGILGNELKLKQPQSLYDAFGNFLRRQDDSCHYMADTASQLQPKVELKKETDAEDISILKKSHRNFEQHEEEMFNVLKTKLFIGESQSDSSISYLQDLDCVIGNRNFKNVDLNSINKPILSVSHIVKTSPAEKAGISVGDKIAKLGNIDRRSFVDVETVLNFVRDNCNRPIRVIYSKKDEEETRETFLVPMTKNGKDGKVWAVGMVLNVIK